MYYVKWAHFDVMFFKACRIRIETVSNNIIGALDVGPKTAISQIVLEARETLWLANLIPPNKPLHQVCRKHQTCFHNSTKHLCACLYIPIPPLLRHSCNEPFNKISQYSYLFPSGK